MTDSTPQPTSGDAYVLRSMFDAANRARAAVTRERDEWKESARCAGLKLQAVTRERDAALGEVGARKEVDRRTMDLLDEVTQERDALREQVRAVLENVTVALGLPLTEAGRPRANSFLWREIGRAIECHDWDWPPARAALGDTP